MPIEVKRIYEPTAPEDGFRDRQEAELREHGALLEPIVERGRSGVVTLLFAACDERHNNAVALRAILRGRGRKRRSK